MTHLFRGNSQGEILDADGKVAGRIVPVTALDWLHGEGEDFECPTELYFRGAPPAYWWRSVFRQKAAADWSSVAVRVPEPQIDKRIFDTEDQKAAWTDGWLSAIFALDAILGAK